MTTQHHQFTAVSTFLSLITFMSSTSAADIDQIQQPPPLDPRGYLLYCPCMGRFGNQADHLLGTIAFAKKLNRTLVVPPFISYDFRNGNKLVPYDRWFNMSSLSQYHRVVEMSVFMRTLAPLVWKADGERPVYCHEAAAARSKDKKTCPAKDGNPFGPFWDSFNVTFTQSRLFKLNFQSSARDWNAKYPLEGNYVMSFMCAMASYPVLEHHRHIQSFVEWSDAWKLKRDELMSSVGLRRKLGSSGSSYLAVHLRNGADWKRACEHLKGEHGHRHHFMSSPQCTGYNSDTIFTHEMCLPGERTVKQQVLAAFQGNGGYEALYVASDHNLMLDDFRELFAANRVNARVVSLPQASVQEDIAVLIEADMFIGTCASSVTAFVVRKRQALKRPNAFFGVPSNTDSSSIGHTDL